MKLFIFLVVLVGLAAGDVSHIANSYLPPHSALSQSRTVSFSPSTGYSTGNSGAYTSAASSALSTSHGISGYSGKLQEAAAQSFESRPRGTIISTPTAQIQPLSAAYNTGAGYTTSSKQTVQKTFSAPILQTQTIQKSYAAPSSFESDGSARASYTAQSPNHGQSFAATYNSGSGFSTGAKHILQKTYSAPIIQQQTIEKSYAAPSSFESSSDGSARASYTAQSPNHGQSFAATYNSGSGFSTGAKHILQKTYSAPIIQQQTIEKSFSAPSSFKSSSDGSASASYTAQSPSFSQYFPTTSNSGSGYSTGAKQIIQTTYTAPIIQQQTIQKTLSSPAVQQQAYTAPEKGYTSYGKTSFGNQSEQPTYSTTALVKESYTAPAKTINTYQAISTPTVQKPILSAPLIEQQTITLPAAQQTFSALGKSHNIYQSYTSPNHQSAIVSSPTVQKTYSAPAAQQQYSSKIVKQSYTAPSVDRSYLAPIVTKASYTAPSPAVKKITYSTSDVQQSFAGPHKFTTTATNRYQSAPIVQQSTFTAPAVQKTTFTSSATPQAYTAPDKAYTSYHLSDLSPVAAQAYTATEAGHTTPITQQSYTAPGKSYTSYQSVSAPAAQKVSSTASLVQQSYTAPGKTFNNYQSVAAPAVQQYYSAPAHQKTFSSFSAPVIQNTSSYTALPVAQSFTSAGKSYTSPAAQKTFSAPLISQQSNTSPALTSFKAQAVEHFSGPSHSSVIAYPGIDTKYAANGGYIY